MKELLDKEVVIVDREEYVKVLNPRAPEGGNQPKYLYIPVNEYLSKRESFTTPTIPKEESKKEFPISSTQPPPSESEREIVSPSPSRSKFTNLKKKVVVAYFDDRTTHGDEVFGDWLAEKLIKEVSQRSQQILFVDYQTVKEFLENKEFVLTDLETPKVLHLLNEVFGIHALVVGQLSGPYIFTTKTAKDQDGMASAIIKIEMRIVDTFYGKTFKNLSANNPLIPTKEKGSFSEEKAKMKAIDLTIAELSRSLSRELDGLDWFCRVAKVDGEEIYINAGRLTGLKVGDVMEVFRPKGPGERGEVKGKIQISAWFGIDASIGQLIQGNKPDTDDILKIARTSSNIERGL
ncbi:MAG: hypothetical protein MUP27_02810 [Desulfobacterales bacterium]|nr:hypothetical protein [Desulfobacterales bacterium]